MFISDYLFFLINLIQRLPNGFIEESSFHFQLTKWDQLTLASAMGPAAVELLATGLEGYINQAKRVEELFGKIWPPPNV